MASVRVYCTVGSLYRARNGQCSGVHSPRHVARIIHTPTTPKMQDAWHKVGMRGCRSCVACHLKRQVAAVRPQRLYLTCQPTACTPTYVGCQLRPWRRWRRRRRSALTPRPCHPPASLPPAVSSYQAASSRNGWPSLQLSPNPRASRAP